VGFTSDFSTLFIIKKSRKNDKVERTLCKLYGDEFPYGKTPSHTLHNIIFGHQNVRFDTILLRWVEHEVNLYENTLISPLCCSLFCINFSHIQS